MTTLEKRKQKIADAVFFERTFVGTLLMTLVILFAPKIAVASQKIFVNTWRSFCMQSIMQERMTGNPEFLKPVIRKEVQEYCG